MKKITLKIVKDLLSKTLFIRCFVSVMFDKEHCNKDTDRLYIIMRRYQAQLTINYDVKTIYVNFYGTLDGYDAKEILEVKSDLLKLLGW